MPLNRRAAAPRRRHPLLLALVLTACGPTDPLSVGVTISGRFTDAARLAFADARAGGGIPDVDTMMLAEQSSEASAAIARAESLSAVPGLVAVIGHSNSAASLAAAPIYNEHRVVQLAPTSTAITYSSAGPFSFRLVPPDTVQGTFIAHVIDSLFPGGARLAVMYVNDDYGRGLRELVSARLDPSRHVVVYDAPHTDTEFRSMAPESLRARTAENARAMAASRPDLLLWLGRPGRLNISLTAIRAAAPDVMILGGDAMAAWGGVAVRGPEWSGIRYVDFLDPQGSEALRDFNTRLLERAGVPAGSPEVLSYDAMQLILTAIREGARTGDEIRKYLNSLGRTRPVYHGLSGPISFSENGDVNRAYVLRQIESNR